MLERAPRVYLNGEDVRVKPSPARVHCHLMLYDYSSVYLRIVMGDKKETEIRCAVLGFSAYLSYFHSIDFVTILV